MEVSSIRVGRQKDACPPYRLTQAPPSREGRSLHEHGLFAAPEFLVEEFILYSSGYGGHGCIVPTRWAGILYSLSVMEVSSIRVGRQKDACPLYRLNQTPPSRVGRSLQEHGLFAAPEFLVEEFILYSSG